MNWPTHPAYKNSGVQWLGEVPAHWGLSPMFTVGHERTLTNAGLSETNLLSLSYGRIVPKDIDTTDGLLPASFDTYQIVEPCDIVFRFTDLQNDKRSLRSALVPERGIITSAYMAFSPTQIDPKYFSYLMRSYDLTKVFYSRGGGLRQSLKYEDVKRLPILVPPTDEQRVISRFLDRETAKIDALIEKQEQLIATLREDRAATIAHAVTKGLNPDVEMKDSGVERLGHIPTHWTVPQIGWHSRVGNGSTPARDNQEYWLNGLVPWLNSGHVNRDRITDADQFVTNSAVLECHLPMVPAGSVLVGLTGQGKTRGMASLLMVPSTINQHLAYVTPISRQIGAAYLCYAIRSSYDYLREISEENGSTKGGLTCSALKKLRIPIPPKNEQDMLVRFLDERCSKIDSLIAKSTEVIDTLREYRSALITNAVTGKIDVREAV